MSRVTQFDARTEIQRLEAAGFRLPDIGSDRLAESWAEAMGDLTLDELSAAVTDYIRQGGRYWPIPSVLRSAVMDARKTRPASAPGDLRGRYNRWASAGDHATEPCPVCGAILQKLGDHWGVSQGDHGRFGVLHDKRQHDAARVSHTGYPYDREYVEGCNTRLAEQRKQGAA